MDSQSNEAQGQGIEVSKTTLDKETGRGGRAGVEALRKDLTIMSYLEE
jgi:hypothetical protein